MSTISSDRLREIVAALSPAECDADHCDDPLCHLIHHASYGDFTRDEYLMARELLSLRESLPIEDGEGWQDISTAPKDGTELILPAGSSCRRA